MQILIRLLWSTEIFRNFPMKKDLRLIHIRTNDLNQDRTAILAALIRLHAHRRSANVGAAIRPRLPSPEFPGLSIWTSPSVDS